MVAIEGQPRQRVGDDRPVTGQQLGDVAGPDQPLQQIERVEVCREVPVRVGDHRRTAAEHHVPGDQSADSIRDGQQQRTESLV